MSNLSRFKRNLLLIRAYGFLVGFWVHLPIMYVYFADHGLSFTCIAVLFSTIAVVSILCEVPSGALADLWGRKYALCIAGLMLAAAFVVLGLGDGFWHFLLGAAVWEVADAFLSGSDTALIYDSLKELHAEERFTYHVGKRWQYWSIGFACSALLTSLVVTYGAGRTFLISAACALASSVLALLLAEPPRSGESEARRYFAHIREAVAFSVTHPQLKRLILYQAVMIGSILVFFQYLQFYLRGFGLKDEWFGVWYAYFTLVSGWGGGQAHRLAALAEGRTVLVRLAWLLAGALFVLGCDPIWPAALAAVTLIELLFGAVPQTVNGLFHLHVSSVNRATVDSFKNFAVNIGYAVLVTAAGLLADGFGFQPAMAVLALCVLAGSLGAIRRMA